MTTKKVTRKPAKKTKTLFDRLDESVFGTPIRIANRTFLAGLGVISTIQGEIGTAQSEWDKRFKKLRQQIMLDPAVPLFVNKNGGRLASRSVRRKLDK